MSSIEQLAHGLGVDPLILTLVIAPLATELPETLYSHPLHQSKQTLAWATSPAPWSFSSCRLSPSAWYSPAGR